MNLLVIFLLIVLLKFFLNLSRLSLTKYCFYKFKKQPKNINEYSPLTTTLFNSAGTQTGVLSTVRSNGLNQGKFDYISNSLSDSESYYAIQKIFYRTIGTYKLRMFQSINPFYWVFLPKYILEYFGKSGSGFIAIIINIVYWAITSIAAYIVENILDMYFRQDLIEWIRHISILLYQ